MPFDCGVAKYVFASVEASIPFPVDFNGVVYDSCAYSDCITSRRINAF